MVFDKNRMFFTIGTWGYETLAQDTKSIFGKIISINLLDRTYKIVSTGHRNPQGIFYDNETNTTLSTEHGPEGGDEFNINHLSENQDKIKNYGWPISSYGMPLNERNNDKLNNEMLKKAPHYKSHKKFGFIEPLIHWSPGIGISDITQVNSNFARSKSNITKHYLIGAMGRKEISYIGALSLNYFELDSKNSKIISRDIIPINERIRDLTFINSSNKLILFLETSGSIAILE
jgi:glucose/arabinose dehydrogenase